MGKKKQSQERAVLVVHGGAGVINRKSMTAKMERDYKQALVDALMSGFKLLKSGRSSLDAVEAAVCALEDCPLFNAGKGAVFTHDERIELEAAIMDGATHAAGSVTGLSRIKNPIRAARAVMEHSDYVLMMGEGAEKFLQSIVDVTGTEFVDPSYFWTKPRYRQLQDQLDKEAEEKGKAKHTVDADKRSGKKGPGKNGAGKNGSGGIGTVGAVALDMSGDLAVATSTGGLSGKKRGRVGDTAIIGSGSYADNKTCAVSCTGTGEYFMRNVIAYDVVALMKYKKLGVAEAAEAAIHKTLQKSGGQGGLIALDGDGNYAMPYNSPGMFRGMITESGEIVVAIFEG